MKLIYQIDKIKAKIEGKEVIKIINVKIKLLISLLISFS